MRFYEYFHGWTIVAISKKNLWKYRIKKDGWWRLPKYSGYSYLSSYQALSAAVDHINRINEQSRSSKTR